MKLPRGGLLALDLARFIGVAYGPLTERIPIHSDTWEMPKFGGTGCIGYSFQETLFEFLKEVKPGHIIMESTLPLPALNNRSAALQAFGMAYMVYAEAYNQSISVSEIDAITARREVLGTTLMGMTDKHRKTEILKRIRQKKIDAKRHDAADAAVIWLWHRYRVGHIPGPLWEAA
jgi:Holliday junction resolvasome RuvABC endonuclease subunit